MMIEKAMLNDADELGRLYDSVNDHLMATVNYPGWKKGLYPVREDAVDAIREGTLFVLREGGKIAGTVILSHREEKGYAQAPWGVELEPEQVLVVHTLAVHPQFLSHGVGRRLMEFAIAHAKAQRMRAVRLDVNERNVPAIRLYESLGFAYIDTVDLGYGIERVEWYRLYQLVL